jgi:hypothetical protein
LCHIHLDRKDDQYITNTKIDSGCKRWIILDSELILNCQGQVTGAYNTTRHSILIRNYVELSFDLTEEESSELTEKVEILLEILDKEVNINDNSSCSCFLVPCVLSTSFLKWLVNLYMSS